MSEESRPIIDDLSYLPLWTACRRGELGSLTRGLEDSPHEGMKSPRYSPWRYMSFLCSIENHHKSGLKQHLLTTSCPLEHFPTAIHEGRGSRHFATMGYSPLKKKAKEKKAITVPFPMKQVILQEVSMPEGIGCHLIPHPDQLPTQNGVGGEGRRSNHFRKPGLKR